MEMVKDVHEDGEKHFENSIETLMTVSFEQIKNMREKMEKQIQNVKKEMADRVSALRLEILEMFGSTSWS